MARLVVSRRLYRRGLLALALACSLPGIAACSNVSGAPLRPLALLPKEPCSLTFEEKAGPLVAQPDLSAPLSPEGLVGLIAQDDRAYNELYQKFNRNIEDARKECVRRPTE